MSTAAYDDDDVYETAEQQRARLKAAAEQHPFEGWTSNEQLKIKLKSFIPRLKVAALADNEQMVSLVNEIKQCCQNSTLRTRLYEVAHIPDPEERMQAIDRAAAAAAAKPNQVVEHFGSFDYHDDDCQCAFYGGFCNRNAHCWSCCGSTLAGQGGCTGKQGGAHHSAVSTGTNA